MTAEPSTPLMRQYHAIKQRFPGTLLLFRLGDFYELFYDDAVTASRILQITLTARNKEKGQPIPMCGVPFHAADNYVAKLIRAGHRVAVCDQLESPRPGIKLVRRGVTRVLTPGTAADAQQVSAAENTFLAAIASVPVNGKAHSGQILGLAYVDLSTGEFRATEFSGADAEARLRDELAVLRPREILLPQPTQNTLFKDSAAQRPPSPFATLVNGAGAVETKLDDWIFRYDYAERILLSHFSVVTLDGFGMAHRRAAIAAAGAIVHYLRETAALTDEETGNAARAKSSALAHLDRIAYYEHASSLLLDHTTIRNLELVAPIFPDEPGTTLVSTMDETATGMGARLLRGWIVRPEIAPAEINARLDGVGEMKSQTVLREELRRILGGVLDLERLTSRITLGLATPRNLLALRDSLAKMPAIRAHVAQAAAARLRELHGALDELGDVHSLIGRAIADDPPAHATEPGVIRAGYHAELDELRELSRTARQTIAAMEERERRRTGIASLKIRYNQVFGYYIEISKPNLHLAPADFERKQTLVNAERFTSPELKEYERKVLSADERIAEIERRLFGELREAIAAQAARIRSTAVALAQLDVLATFAQLAATRNWARPVFAHADEGRARPLDFARGAETAQIAEAAAIAGAPADADGELMIVGGRHPVIERLCEQRGERFVPNDVYLNASTHRILLITGPNMGGKSTYLRQTALIVLMAQMGSFVPTAEARLPITDRIFTRIGASDNLARGRSTFLVEMSEVAAILNTATPASLVLLDEVGRGTATFDGLSIAWAVVEHLDAQTRARTLFATHYHELTELAELLEGVKNLHVTVRESGSEIIFLRRVEPGAAGKSFGIEVARLAGLPRAVIERAREVLVRHEQSEHALSEELSPGAIPHQADIPFGDRAAAGNAADSEGESGSTAETSDVGTQHAVPLPEVRRHHAVSSSGAAASPAIDPAYAAAVGEILSALRNVDLDALSPLEALNLLARLKKNLS